MFGNRRIVFSVNGSMFAIFDNGGTALSLFSTHHNRGPFTVSGDVAYAWIQPTQAAGWELRSCAIGTCLSTFAPKVADVAAAALATMHRGTIFWTKATDPSNEKPTTSLNVIDTNADPVTLREIVASTRAPAKLVADETHVYWAEAAWTEQQGGSSTNVAAGILRVAAQGGAPEQLARRDARVQSLVIDDKHVYWGEAGYRSNEGAYYRVPLLGGATEVVQDRVECPRSIAVDKDAIYFTTGCTQSSVMKLAK
jgi:hypothetical protein